MGIIRHLSICAAWLAAAACAAGEAVRVPVPFLADRDPVLSGMVLEVSRQSYDSIGRDGAVMAADPAVQAFFGLVEALETREAEQVMERVRLSPNENPQDRLKLVLAFQDTFAGQWDDVRLLARYDIGAGTSSYIWSVPADAGALIRSFRLSGREDGFRWMDSTVQGPVRKVETLLVQAEQLRATGLPFPSAVTGYRYQYPLPGMDASLLFNGTVLRWDAFGDAYPDLPVARMYHEAMRAFSQRDLDGFAGFYTPHSARKFLDWARAMPAAEFDAYHASVLAGREVRFILDADPLYVIFYNTPETLRHDLVIREGSAFRITSFYIESFLDDLLLDRALFVDPVLAAAVSGGVDEVAYVTAAAPAAAPAAAAAPSAATPAPPSAPAPLAVAPAGQPESAACPSDGCTRCWLVFGGVALLLLALAYLVIKRKSRQP